MDLRAGSVPRRLPSSCGTQEAKMPTYTFEHRFLNALASDAGLDDIRVKEFPTFQLGEVSLRWKELPKLEFGDLNVRWKEIPRIELHADTRADVQLSIKEVPELRTHVPAHYDLGISIFGVPLVCFSLCGESQIITEKYRPRRPERCE
jgi:hypothetical protein